MQRESRKQLKQASVLRVAAQWAMLSAAATGEPRISE